MELEGTNQLVYEVEVTNGSDIREIVFVNAHVGKVVNRYSLVHDALFRRAVRAEHRQPGLAGRRPFPGSLNSDQQNIVNFSGDSYCYFFNAFGRDSYDGAGRRDAVGQQRPDDRLPERQLERRSRRTTATASPPTTSSPTSGATRTPSSPTT